MNKTASGKQQGYLKGGGNKKAGSIIQCSELCVAYDRRQEWFRTEYEPRIAGSWHLSSRAIRRQERYHGPQALCGHNVKTNSSARNLLHICTEKYNKREYRIGDGQQSSSGRKVEDRVVGHIEGRSQVLARLRVLSVTVSDTTDQFPLIESR